MSNGRTMNFLHIFSCFFYILLYITYSVPVEVKERFPVKNKQNKVQVDSSLPFQSTSSFSEEMNNSLPISENLDEYEESSDVLQDYIIGEELIGSSDDIYKSDFQNELKGDTMNSQQDNDSTNQNELLIALQAVLRDADNHCFTNEDCPKDALCYKEKNSCGSNDRYGNYMKAPGVCVLRPQKCKTPLSREAAEGMKVCGCDGITYPNECLALKNSSLIAYKGECKSNYNPSGAYRSSDSHSSNRRSSNDPTSSHKRFFADAKRN